MAKGQRLKSHFLIISILFFICLTFFIPIILQPSLLTTKDNDLGRTYIPLFSFIRRSFYQEKSIPLWRPEQMMGESLIASPISSLFYPPNTFFLIFPVNFAAIIHLFFHFFTAAIFTFFLAKSFNLSSVSALAAAIFYAFSTKMLVHLEAGHITMLASFSYLPLAFLAIRKILTKPSFGWIICCSISLTFSFFTYPTIAYYLVLFLIIYWIYYQLFNKVRLSKFSLGNFKKDLVTFFLIFAVFLGLSAIVLFPQMEFAANSTRSQLKFEDVALPLWNLQRFLKSLIWPYSSFGTFDHESFLYLGAAVSVLSIFGFTFLPLRQKVTLFIFGLLILMFVAGQSTPIFKLAYDYLPLLKYSRITTRVWFVVALLASLLAATALDRFKSKNLVYLIIIIAAVELFWIGYRRIFAVSGLNFSNLSLYDFLVQDKDIFRVYCTTYCFNPQLISKHQIQTLHGESPIQDSKYVQFLEKAGNYSYNNFAVIFPSYQVWQVENPPTPNAKLLALANVKYVASTYPVMSQYFSPIGKFDDIYLYLNKNFLPRAYFLDSPDLVEIEKYQPNTIKIKFPASPELRTLIISEIDYPGWFVYQNNHKYPVENFHPIFRKVTVSPVTESIELRYQPKMLEMGKTITFATIIFVIMLYLRKFRQKLNG